MGLVGAIVVIMFARLTLTGWSDERIKIWAPRNRMIKLTEDTAVYAVLVHHIDLCVLSALDFRLH